MPEAFARRMAYRARAKARTSGNTAARATLLHGRAHASLTCDFSSVTTLTDRPTNEAGAPHGHAGVPSVPGRGGRLRTG